jgi:hypothetical protein
MLRNFVFEPLADQPEITRVAPGIVQRPVIAGEARIQLPVGVRRLE